MTKSNDVESAVVFKGQPADDESSVDDLAKQKASASATTRASQRQQPCWKRHKWILLGTLATAIIVAVALTATTLLRKNNNKTNSSSGKLSGVGGLEAEPLTSEAPTKSPSLSPSVTPQWDIVYQAMGLDFSSGSEHEIEVQYKVGVGRVVKTQVYARDCVTAIDKPVLDLTLEKNPLTMYQDLVSVKYKVDKTALSGSNIWVDELNEIQVCQVVQLVLPASTEGGLDFVIAEDKRTLDIDITLEVNFGVGFQVPLSSGVQQDAIEVASEGLDEIMREEGSEELP